MGRPKYETKRDIETENEFIRNVSIVDKCFTAVKLNPVQYHIDFAVYKSGELKVIAEVKRRHNDHNYYPTYMIAMSKLFYGISFSDAFSVPFILAIKFNDGWYCYTNGKNVRHKISFSGRNDRNDEFDKEPCVHIPCSAFVRLDTNKMLEILTKEKV